MSDCDRIYGKEAYSSSEPSDEQTKIRGSRQGRRVPIYWNLGFGWQALAYAVAVLVFTGLAPAWGMWYSGQSYYRAQVDAFLEGELALSDDPAALRHDLVWAQGGVHQVWGLGVPLWRTPFELMARLFGVAPFPGILAFGIALAGMAWLVFRVLLGPWVAQQEEAKELEEGEGGDEGEGEKGEGQKEEQAGMPATRQVWRPALRKAMGAVPILLAFPPFMVLLQSRFAIYEEPIAYGYIYAVGLFLTLLSFYRRPSVARFWVLCVVAGLGPMIRPTMLFYSVSAIGVGGVLALRWRFSWRAIGMGAGLFGLGGALLFASNVYRFGSGVEFGHRLNVQHGLYGSKYATRFDYPFKEEGLLSASRELVGVLFFVRDISGGLYADDKFWGQSETTRWREIYMKAYDWSHLVLLGITFAAGWVYGVRRWRRRGRDADKSEASGAARDLGLLAIGWSGLALLLLAGFYVKTPVMASRYTLDFAAAFAVALTGGFHLLPRRAVTASLLLVVAWSGWQITKGESGYGRPNVWDRERIEPFPGKLVESIAPSSLPGVYKRGDNLENLGIPFNGNGWGSDTGRVAPVVTFFVSAPGMIELKVEPAGSEVTPKSEPIRVRMGLERLERKSIERLEDGWRIRFQAPQQAMYQQGLHPVFIAFGPKEDLAEEHAGWRLTEFWWNR